MKTEHTTTRRFHSWALLLLLTFLLPGGTMAGDRYKTLSAMPRIIGGDKATADAWPWMVALVNGPDNYSDQFCGGVLIAPGWVATAAHCAVADPPWEVLIGVDNLNESGERIQVTRAHIHPGYFNSNGWTVPDIALLELATEATQAPIALYRGSSDLTGVTATIIGWGTTSPPPNETWPLDLMEAQVPIVSTADCTAAYGFEITQWEVCAGEGGVDSCTGDSGGPMMIDDGGVYKLAGIVSWGEGCADPAYYGVYARISALVDWIDGIMKPLAGDYDGNGSLGPEDSIGILQEISGVR